MDANINKKIDIGSIKLAKYDFYRRHLLVKKCYIHNLQI